MSRIEKVNGGVDGAYSYECLREVEETLQEDRISRVAVNADGKAIGWIAGSSSYKGNVWDIHPLIVHNDYRNKCLLHTKNAENRSVKMLK
ncbi:GNAT family N-acetyltransferase [Paenibacillus lemnae]|uniref:GNAT family N-acetyltransferase n=1 Tax=Paenibacillus lemnae TaxID=1330551 RepID=UPI003CCD2DB1